MTESIIFTTDKKPNEITSEIVAAFIERHNNFEVERLRILRDYYKGNHPILNRQKESGLSNNRTVTNHASYISNFASSYLLGEPVTYTAAEDKDIKPLLSMLKKADSPTQDSDLALDVSIFGRGCEVIYFSSDDDPTPKLAKVSPLNAFVVYDNTVEQKPVFGVYYYPAYSKIGTLKGYVGQYMTDSVSVKIYLSTNYQLEKSEAPKAHYFGEVPIIEYYNNGDRQGDFEQVTSLIDAYNILQSDRINDKEQFVDALLLIKGQVLGDTDEESAEAYKTIKESKVMQLDSEGDAAFLTRQFDENALDVLRKAIAADIHKISGIPDMTDQSFAANSSGVAMTYKLLALEQITKIKERYFVEGLRIRLRAFVNALVVKGGAKIDTNEIEIIFKRSLPVNLLELSQVASNLKELVPEENLLGLFPFVKDVQAAMDKLKKQKEEAVSSQQAMFMNTPINSREDEE